MNRNDLKNLLEELKQGHLSVDETLEQLKGLPFSSLSHSRIDHHRSLRTGFPEVIFCEGKENEEIKEIAEELLEKGTNVLATRANETIYSMIENLADNVQFHDRASCITIVQEEPEPLEGQVGIISAGTSDNPVAEEARVTCETFGAPVETAYDVGVAGLHRLLPEEEIMRESSVLIVAAGMEGALPSVVGGLSDKPIIGVPTSTGYGAAFGGLTALLGMLNSCTPSVVTVNIDNGFGAAFFACTMLKSNKE